MKLKVLYTIPELAKMADISRWQMERLLRENGVPLTPVGRRRAVVLLIQLRKVFPDLWDSIAIVEHMK